MDLTALADLQSHQAGVLSRGQVLACGGDDNDIERMIRRREWTRIATGCYLNHTGQPAWEQRAWAAVLCHWPAVLVGTSALAAHGLRHSTRLQDLDRPIEVGVDASRCPKPSAGVRVRRLKSLGDLALWHLGPPRIRLEHALLDVAARARDEAGAVAVLADACQERRTTPQRLLDVVASMPRLGRRKLIEEILGDVASGAYSVLERRYLRLVERRHGLPTAARQRVVRSGRTESAPGRRLRGSAHRRRVGRATRPRVECRSVDGPGQGHRERGGGDHDRARRLEAGPRTMPPRPGAGADPSCTGLERAREGVQSYVPGWS